MEGRLMVRMEKGLTEEECEKATPCMGKVIAAIAGKMRVNMASFNKRR